MSFKIEDEDQRIFSLKFLPTSQPDDEKRLRWKISDSSRPGVAMLMNQSDVDIEDWDQLSDEQAEKKMQQVGANAYKQLLMLSSFLELLDPYPEILPSDLRNKPDVLGMCIEDEDPPKIYDFFYSSLNDTTISAGDGEPQQK